MTLRWTAVVRLAVAGSAALLAAALLGACASPGTGLQREAATQFQARVLEVTQAASQDDPASALKALDGLESDLSAAAAKGQVSEERSHSITTVASAVRADLNDAVAAQQAAAKAAEDARTAAQKAAQSPSATADAPASQPAPAQGGSGSGAADTAKNNGGDKGKGKN
ncbi:hypothetical protein [Arthrobacter sp. SLBN-112]|uniref:hypothetical protein n=1 Tax=Arthrobacter sp. SLBN-112 TaxID=2768452 RepID=UPI0027B6CD87|nr:hypothetical protein [Arthrobacter sp. SLBN-112]MDQ0802063.1 hypothetical protein [Arthrobacter sp. SLBN-112]